MSIVYIKEHSENIYHIACAPDDLLESQGDEDKIGDEVVPTPMDHMVRKQGKILKTKDRRIYHPHAYFGVPNASKPDPQNFLKKKAGHILQAHFIPKYSRKRKVLTIPKVPNTKATVEEQMKKLAFPPVNIIKRNIDKIINTKPKVPDRIVVLDRYGTKQKFANNLEIKYITSRGFSKLPKYIDKYKMKKESKFLDDIETKAKAEQPLCNYIIRDARERLLEGLKSNWEELQSQYQTLPILTDTIPKKNRMSQIEKALRQLEKDVVLIERHPYIYVYQDDPTPEK